MNSLSSFYSSSYKRTHLKVRLTNLTSPHSSFCPTLQEIVLAITAEYTDWARPVQHPVNIRDLTAEALHDACYVSPVTVSANQLYTPARSSYLYVLDYRPTDPDPVSGPELPLNELVYVFGAPLGAHGPLSVGQNFTTVEVSLSEAVITLWTNFIKTGNPNDSGSSDWYGMTRERQRYRTHNWTHYDPVHRRYLDLGTRGRIREHYRADRVALWSWLVPGLEQVGSRYGPDSPFHRLPNYLQPDTFSGPTRPTNLSSNFLPPPTTPAPTTPEPTTPAHTTPLATERLYPNISGVQGPMESPNSEANVQGTFPYTTALSLTVAIGCSLLILNLLVFAAVYYRRDASRPPFAKNSHDGNSDSGNDVHLHPTCEPCKPISPSHYGTLRSSATLRSSLATSFENDPQHEWPPDYTASCQSSEEASLCAPSTQCHTGQPHNGTASRRTRQALTTYSPHVDTQLSPTSYTHDETPDMHV
ncbi:hypothetical protein Pmani_022307 [Petrolisthes manimaculis]|uniref:Carboxylesterase type B domain-containing protein n=1 Tax=Petrolisthes manimaculis TaxID=1843537 RepID=A0AAE1PCY8_9EUCA|nr:hypothetical protein Pmani_022307 [Petrolisthes manimaculis]